jgi:3-isopropylmalate dehydrogenase
MKLMIGILEGDDIGHEVVPECVKTMSAAAQRVNLEIEWFPLPIGRKGHAEVGHTFPQSTVETLRKLHGWIQGPIGHAEYPHGDPTWINPPTRKVFDLFASVKPVRSHPRFPSLHSNIDIVFLRELTEGMQSANVAYAGSAEFRPNRDLAIGSRVITRAGTHRLAREAFEIAKRRPRRMVHAVHKEPVFKQTCGLFAEECRNVAALYPDVELKEMHIDTSAMKLVTNPQQFDVIVTTNQFGDILTDLGAGLIGGLGLAPGLCIGEHQAMAQATHGSAPDIAGKRLANPYAMIMSGMMLLQWLGRKHGQPLAVSAAGVLEKAVAEVVDDGIDLTADLGGQASTDQMGDAILEKINVSAIPVSHH